MSTDGAEWAAFDDGQWSRVDHTGTPIDLLDSTDPVEEVTQMYESGPDGGSGGSAGVAELTGCWETSRGTDA